MRTVKFFRIVSIWIIFILICSVGPLLPVSVFAESGVSDLWVDASGADAASYEDGRKETDMIHWWKNEDDGKYYLTVPNSADLSNLRVFFKSDNRVKAGKKEIVSGQPTDAFAEGGAVRVVSGTSIYDVVIQKASKIASMFITTESGSLDTIHQKKDNREAGKMLLVDADGNTIAYNGNLESMKGRGNATWDYPKKPYNIKLEKSTDLLSMGKAKDWCLLSNWVDATHLHNTVAFHLAEEVGIDFTPDSRPVDLYINNQYAGLYVLTEKIEVNKERVDIENLEKATEKANDSTDLSEFGQSGSPRFEKGTNKYWDIRKDPADITGGYLLEYELKTRYADEASGFVTNKGQAIVVKSPEYASQKQVEYISKFVQEMEDAIYSSTGKNAKGKHYSEYINVESFAKMYLVQEYCMNLDVGITSFYLYKDSDSRGDGKLHAAPVWDFDNALGTAGERDGVDLNHPEKWWAAVGRIYYDEEWTPHVMAALMQKQEDFRIAVIREWHRNFAPALEKLTDPESTVQTKTIRYIEDYIGELRDSADHNFILWQGLFGHGNSFESGTKTLKNFLKKRLAFMDREFESAAETALLTVKCVNKESGETIYTKSAKAVLGYPETVNAPELQRYALDEASAPRQEVMMKTGGSEVVFYYNRVSAPSLEKDQHIQYINGYEDGTVRPDAAITRAEAASIFWRLITDSDKNIPVTISMSDVDGDAWYAQAVKYLAREGILRGYSDGAFRPGQTITRAEFTAIVSRFDVQSGEGTQVFSDVPADHWAAAYIASTHQKGWIGGYSDGTFHPDQSITRAEVAKVVNRMLERTLKAENVPAELWGKYTDLPAGHWAFADIIEASVAHAYTKDADGSETWK